MSDQGSTHRPALPPQQPPAQQGAPPQRQGRGSTTQKPLIAARNAEVPAPAELSGELGPLDSQPTIITKSPALAAYPLSPMHPREIGRLLEGERLGHFDLLEYVGGGGMGAVFRAHDTMLNRTVAVKVLSHEQSGDEETLRRFQNEAQSAARLDHQNISRVFYVGEDRGWHYIVFEFIEGSNLRDVVAQQGPLPLQSAISYVLQVAEALAHASDRDVVHRDIKPSNVLITPEGHAKLVDMGLARLHQVEPAENDLTASGVTLGTFDYISPEQARDPRSADVRSDIYSLGCTLYFMLTGRPPFPEGTVLQKLLQHQGDTPVDPRTFRADLPDDLLRIVDRMLAKSPERRYQRAEDLVAELTAFAGRHGLDSPGSGSLVWVPPSEVRLTRWERHMPWIVPVVLLVVIVAVLGVFWSHEADQSGPPPVRPAGTGSKLERVPQERALPANDIGSADANRDLPDASNGKPNAASPLPTESPDASAQRRPVDPSEKSSPREGNPPLQRD